MTPTLHQVICGDCEAVLQTIPDDSIDLIITSPPQADPRRHGAAGISPDEYVDWFLPKSRELLRVLKPTGTFILNIKERVVNGERHTYVLELILRLREQGWLWTEEFVWHKRSVLPGKWPNRFRDSWERCLQFNKQRHFAMYQQAVMVPSGLWAQRRQKGVSEPDRILVEARTRARVGKKVAHWVRRDMAYPTNVLRLATEYSNRDRHDVFPPALPEWFIRLFTRPGNLVLDPFVGSGTSAVVAKSMNRRCIGIDSDPDSCALAEAQLAQIEAVQMDLM